ncbi:hypothetical protein E1B28_005269 [Marasmius oreades]|uniref:Uncharacterized protein n=1 Tax=Marasmius oreades TaxID=181124 RepID=A0A9P7V0B9_9AGAR|nr:uncharacterized protein E1B28_005269 [Marasmius oreades]KAG7097958.1 hypothetical protein E1B28_005269 [Marasmius oreades]
MFRVRRFQVGPAELEGTILDNQFADHVCVLPLPDAYSSELPLAYIVSSQIAKETISKSGNQNVNRKSS